MPVAVMAGQEVELNDEGFLVNHTQWTKDIGEVLAANIGIELTPKHWEVIEFMRSDFEVRDESPTLRRVTTQLGVTPKELFGLFPKKPAKKMAYIAGVPKPAGCI